MNILDKVINYISPSWAYKRMHWRMGIRQAYDAGKVFNTSASWVPYNAKAEQLNEAERDFIRARARDRERNSDFMQSLIKAYERNVVGSGFRVQSQIEDEKLGNEMEKIFSEWAKPRNCEVTGQLSFREICKMIIRRRIIDGGILIVKTYNGNKKYPFQIQFREVDDLDTAVLTGSNGNMVINGVEINRYQKPVAYHLKVYSPDGWDTGKTERIPAQRVLFLFDKKMPSQIREISETTSMLTRTNDIDDYIHTLSLKEKIQAAFTVFIKRQLPTMIGGLGRNIPAQKREKYPITEIKPGMIFELQPGDDATSIVPNGQAQNAKEYISAIQRMGASALGIGYENASRDMSNVNYSSARQNLLEDQKNFTDWQMWLIEHFLMEIYTEVIISAILAGTLNVKNFWGKKKDYLAHRWIAPGWSWIDPQKEVNANKIAMETGQDSVINICAKAGLDYKEVLEDQAKVLAYKKALEEKYGINFSSGSAISTVPKQQTNEEEENAAESKSNRAESTTNQGNNTDAGSN